MIPCKDILKDENDPGIFKDTHMKMNHYSRKQAIRTCSRLRDSGHSLGNKQMLSCCEDSTSVLQPV